MMHRTFGELLTRYQNGQSTPEEYLELIRLIKGGDHDDQLKRHIDEALLYQDAASDLNEDRAKELLEKILHSEKHTAKLIRVSLPRQRLFRRLTLAAAVVIVSVGAGCWIYGSGRREARSNAGNLVDAGRPVTVARSNAGGKKFLRLDDGSTVLLNEGSRLDINSSYNTATREVILTGEGYFEIRQDRSKPFIVHTGKINTTVLGTAFNIKAYPGEKEVVVTVTRGKVKVGRTEGSFRIVTANESVFANTVIDSSREERTNAEPIVDWKKNCLVLDNISMQEAAVLIGSRYHVNISFSRSAIKNCRISATFLNDESLEKVLSVVAEVINATYTIEPNDQVIITGVGCS